MIASLCFYYFHSFYASYSNNGAYEASLNAVHGLVNVNSDNSFRTKEEEEANKLANGSSVCPEPFKINANNTLLWEGSKNFGFIPEKIPRNVKGCVDCGHCCHGCPYEAKQSTCTALMEPLLLAGSGLGGHSSCTGTGTGTGTEYALQVIPHCHVSKVLYEHGDVPGGVCGSDGRGHSCYKRAVGVEGTVRVMPDNFPDMSIKDRLHYINYGPKLNRYVLHIYS